LEKKFSATFSSKFSLEHMDKSCPPPFTVLSSPKFSLKKVCPKFSLSKVSPKFS